MSYPRTIFLLGATSVGMPKTVIPKCSAAGRVLQYPGEFYSVEGKLWCTWCSVPVEHGKMDTVKGHLESTRYQQSEATKRRHGEQTALLFKPDVADLKREVVLDFLQMCASPFNKAPALVPSLGNASCEEPTSPSCVRNTSKS